MAQVNPLVLKYTVDQVTELTKLPHPMDEGIHILVIISAILLGKELLNIFIQFGQKRRDTNTASDPDLGFFKNVAPQGY